MGLLVQASHWGHYIGLMLLRLVIEGINLFFILPFPFLFLLLLLFLVFLSAFSNITIYRAAHVGVRVIIVRETDWYLFIQMLQSKLVVVGGKFRRRRNGIIKLPSSVTSYALVSLAQTEEECMHKTQGGQYLFMA